MFNMHCILQVLEARPSIMLLVVAMHNVVKYVFNSKKNSAFYLLLALMLYFYYSLEYIIVQILIAKGTSLTAENANGYVFLVSHVLSLLACALLLQYPLGPGLSDEIRYLSWLSYVPSVGLICNLIFLTFLKCSIAKPLTISCVIDIKSSKWCERSLFYSFWLLVLFVIFSSSMKTKWFKNTLNNCFLLHFGSF